MRPSVMAGFSALSLVLAACGGGREKESSRPEAEGSSTVQVPTGGGTATTIHLAIGGGPHAGSYDAQSNDITCSYGLTGPGSWGNQYSATGKKPTEFSSLQLIVPDTKDAADGTEKFLLIVGFGQLMQPSYSEHTIDTSDGGSNKQGSGTLTVDDRGQTAKVSFKGKTKDNVTLEGTIDCHQLLRGEG